MNVGDKVIVLTGKFSGQLGWVIRLQPAVPDSGWKVARSARVVVRLRRAGRWHHVAYALESVKAE